MYIKQHFDPRRHDIFVPSNPEKYSGKLPIITRSSWEMSLARWLDATPAVLEWSSESLIIQYFNPVKQRIARYHPDFTAKIRNKEGRVNVFVIEIKPYKETKPPRSSIRKSKKTMLTEEKTYIVNQAKWQAAESYCKRHGYVFKIMTERDLFVEKKRK